MATKAPDNGRFTAADARHFYDRFGARQDQQGFYEDAALERLIRAGSMDTGQRIFEFGCGTGRIAAQLLKHCVNTQTQYQGVDISRTMIDLARKRLATLGERVRLNLVEGIGQRMPVDSGWADRFFTSYVFDLLALDSIAPMLVEAARIVTQGGLFCHTGITPGTGLGLLVSTGWSTVHRLHPAWVGGCRPIVLREHLQRELWEVLTAEQVCRWGITSEILVARRR